MEASALSHPAPALVGRSPLLRLQSDERLIALIRRGHHGAFEALVQRYQSRLLAFCRHMLNSTEDAEDVLQEVFASAFNAIQADTRAINARPWLYRIARNRCLNHLRRPVHSGQDSMDVFERDGGTTTADTVHKREEFRQIVADVQDLPETQRTALLLREIDALSYDQIAEAMDQTVPGIKSLLVRARVSLAEAAEARLLSCAEVRLELGQVAEGMIRSSAPVRRHLRTCDRCKVFKGELRRANKALAAVYPIGPFIFLQKLVTAKLGGGAAAAGGSGVAGGTATGGSALAGGSAFAGGAAAGGAGAGAGGALSAGFGAVASKAAAGLMAAAVVTAGAVEVKRVQREPVAVSPAPAQVEPSRPAPVEEAPAVEKAAATPAVAEKPAAQPEEAPAVATPAPAPAAEPEVQATPAAAEKPASPDASAEGSAPPADGTEKDSSGAEGTPPGDPAQPRSDQSSPAPGEPSRAPAQQQPTPVAGETPVSR